MRLFEVGGMLHTEALPVARTNSGSLDKARLENYLKDILLDPDVPASDEEWEKRLAALGFLIEPGGICTVAGLVLFGKKPRQYLKIVIDEISNKPERDVARVLVEKLGNDCIFYHSYPWLKSERNDRGTLTYLQEGEADFVVIGEGFDIKAFHDLVPRKYVPAAMERAEPGIAELYWACRLQIGVPRLPKPP